MRTSIIALGAALAAATPAHAQTVDRPSGWTPTDIVVTARKDSDYTATDTATLRTPVPILETPQSVQVLTRTLIDEQSLATLAEALRNISGVVPAQPSEAVLIKPIVRGFSSEIYVDGLPQYGDASTYDPSSLIGVERIEIAKGPTSQLFGGGTGAPVGGLINVISQSPEQKASYSATFRAGSFRTIQPSVDINQPLGRNVAARIAAEYVDAKDAIDAVTNSRVTVAPSLKIGFDDTSLVLRANYNRIEQLEYSGLPFAMAGYPGVDPFHFTGARNGPKTTIENVVLTGVFTHRLSDHLTTQVQVRSYNNTMTEHGSFPYLAFYPPAGTVYPIVTAYMPGVRIREMTFDGSLTGTFATGPIEHVLIAGAQYDMVDYHGAMGFNLVPVGLLDYSNPSSDVPFGPTAYPVDTYVNTYRTLGFYAQDQMTIGGRLHVLAGLRYSRLESTEGFDGMFGPKHRFNHVDPRIGVTFDLADGVALFAGYATGSREAIFFNPTVTPTTPETSRSWEGGVKFALRKAGLSGTLALFDQTRNHTPLTDPLSLTTHQIGQQRARGGEADVIWEPSKRFSLLASYAYTDAEVTQDAFTPANVGQQLSRVPEHSGRIAARYRFLDGPLEGFGLGAGMTAASGSQTTLPNTDKTKGYAVFDAQTSYETGPFRISASVTNLTNKLYFLPYLYLNQSVVRPGTPRSAFLAFSVKY
ncbi:TonB-dependent siderophore receptor [Sphingopyxis sp. GC21]|uniref:TonB-dependent siderophore receptor n=1 Tax=Sphingopyxis sp. GC21 TaxID=2933562 RepID=UPI0021E4994E|nr:TonB-dependent receptor [Sphingopyxis sp. GC21]